MTTLIILIISFFFISLVYSIAGFGGGSSYLALLALLGTTVDVMRPTALLCNIMVVTGGTFIFYKAGHIDLKKSWPFLATSIPFSFIGGYWKIDDVLFFQLLGISLLIASIFLWLKPQEVHHPKSGNVLLNVSLGSGLGLLSGLVSIGGGIFLSPILHLLQWDTAKRISAMASLFILVNSISGLAGQFTRSATMNVGFIIPLLIAVLIGGQIGSRLGARQFNPLYIKWITAVLIFLAGLNILHDHL